MTSEGPLSTTRAPRGGTTGKNGEFYKGGTFLPSTTLPKQSSLAGKSSGKEEVSPYEWDTPPQGQRSIYSYIRGFVAWTAEPSVLKDVMLRMNNTEADVAEYEDLLGRYLAGERWFTPRPPRQTWRTVTGDEVYTISSPDNLFDPFQTSQPDLAAYELARLQFQRQLVRVLRDTPAQGGRVYLMGGKKGQELRVQIVKESTEEAN